MNRAPYCLLVLRPTEEFAQWVIERMPIFTGDEAHIRTDGEAYLLPCFDDRAVAQDWVEKRWRFFLEQQLLDWVPDRRHWPKRLLRSHFVTWFELELREVVWDLTNSMQLHH